MANRLNTFPTFANLAPPWSLPTLDNNFVTINSFANDSILGFNNVGTDTGTTNNYVVALAYGAPSAYNQGMTVTFLPLNSNTGSSSITVSPLGSVSILSASGGTLAANTIQANVIITLVYVGTSFRPIAGIPSNTFNNSLGMIGSPGTTTINSAGFTLVNVSATLGTTGLYIFSLTNFALGTIANFTIMTNGLAKHISIMATNPSSATYDSIGISTGSYVTFSASGFTNSSNYMTLTGFATFDQAAGNPLVMWSINYA